jgi:hypothetical protein
LVSTVGAVQLRFAAAAGATGEVEAIPNPTLARVTKLYVVPPSLEILMYQVFGSFAGTAQTVTLVPEALCPLAVGETSLEIVLLSGPFL